MNDLELKTRWYIRKSLAKAMGCQPHEVPSEEIDVAYGDLMEQNNITLDAIEMMIEDIG